MLAPSRLLGPRGPRFYGEGAQIMFVNVLDSTTREGPRQATKADSLAHVEAWAKFTGELPDADPLNAGLSFRDVEEGEGPTDPEAEKPADEPGPYAKRRQAARDRGEEA